MGGGAILTGWRYPHIVLDGGGPLSHLADGGYPGTPPALLGLDGVSPVLTWDGGTPHPGLDGVPPGPDLQDWMGYPPPPARRQSSIASTSYAAGGMPLAFTQEDFLVNYWITVEYFCRFDELLTWELLPSTCRFVQHEWVVMESYGTI